MSYEKRIREGSYETGLLFCLSLFVFLFDVAGKRVFLYVTDPVEEVEEVEEVAFNDRG